MALQAGAQLDQAIALYPRMEAFLQQTMEERVGHGEATDQLNAIFQA